MRALLRLSRRPKLVVDAQDDVEVREQILLRQEIADHMTDDRRTAESTAHQHLEAELARLVALQVQTDVVHLVRPHDRLAVPVTAILNFRGRYENSGCSVAHWRTISQ